jgi:hypothetical protein
MGEEMVIERCGGSRRRARRCRTEVEMMKTRWRRSGADEEGGCAGPVISSFLSNPPLKMDLHVYI